MTRVLAVLPIENPRGCRVGISVAVDPLSEQEARRMKMGTTLK